MAEPENHTLHLLREFREESRQFQGEVREFQGETRQALADVRGDIADLRGDLSEVRVRVGETNQHVDKLIQAVAGEIVKSRYATAAVDDRLTEIERRLAALEQTR